MYEYPKGNEFSTTSSETSRTVARSNFMFREPEMSIWTLHVLSYLPRSQKRMGTALDADTQVVPVNLFSPMDASLNKRLISPSISSLTCRAMIETSLNYGEDAKTSQLSMAMFYMVKPGKMNVPTLGLKTMLQTWG